MKFIDLFSGIGGFRSGLEKNGHECIGFAEIDKYAIQSYKALYDTENEIEFGDISKIENLQELSNDVDIVVGGSPCFRKGTLITTKEGLKPIEDIKKGDYVLTHNNRYKKVVVPMVNPSNEIYKLKAMNSIETFVTPEHPFYVIERSKVWNNKRRSYDYEYSEEKWVKARDLVKGKHFIKLGQANEVNNLKNITKEEAWLIGRYIADGYLMDSKRANRQNSYRKDVVFCVGKDKKDVFESNLQYYKMNPSENRTVYKYRKQNERLFNLMSICGKGAKNKEIPFEYLQLPKDKLEILLEGYFSGDGSYKDNVYSYTTISKKLALSLVQAMNKVYGNGASIVFTERPKTTLIEGRTVNQNDTYRVQLRKEYLTNRKPQTLNIDNELYAPIKELEKQETRETVYNFEVEDDNSYVANNMVVHNCQSFSTAGKKGGFEDTRGTLFFEYARVVKETQPDYFLYENVKGMVSHDKGKTIRTVLETFDELGYYVDFNIFNSKYYDVPQNRERIYILGKRKDLIDNPIYQETVKGKNKINELHNWAVDNINYVKMLPKLRTEVTTRFIDVLEDKVDEKYYLSEEKTKNLTLNEDLSGKLNHYGYRGIDAVYALDGVSPTLNTMQGGNRQPKIAVIGNTSKTEYKSLNITNDVRIRRLTPLECWRLQGFSDEQFYKAKESGVSNSQLYKQAGNSVTVNVVDAIVQSITTVDIK